MVIHTSVVLLLTKFGVLDLYLIISVFRWHHPYWLQAALRGFEICQDMIVQEGNPWVLYYIYICNIHIYILFCGWFYFIYTFVFFCIYISDISDTLRYHIHLHRRPEPYGPAPTTGRLGQLARNGRFGPRGGPSVGFKPWGKMVVDIWGNLLKWWVSPTGRKILLKMISTWGVTWGYLPPFKETHPVNIASGMQTLYNTLDTNYTDICIYESILAAAWCICMIWKKQMILWILLYVICRGFYLLGYMWDCFWTAVDAFLVSRWYCWWRRSCTTWHILETCKQTVNLDYTY